MIKIYVPAVYIIGTCLISCSGYINISERADYRYYKNKVKAQVLQVQTTDEIFVFSEKKPGRMTSECIKGNRQVRIEDFGPDSLVFENERDGSQINFAYKYGTSYNVIDHKGTAIVFVPEEQVCIPYSDIERLQVKVFKPGRTVMFISGLSGSLLGASSRMVSNVTFDMGLSR